MTPRFHPFVRLFITTVLMVAVNVLFYLVIAVALRVAALTSDRTPTSLITFITNNALPLQMLLYPLELLVLWACRRLIDRLSFRSLGLRLPGGFGPFASGAACAVLALGIVFTALWLCGLVQVQGLSQAARASNVPLLLLIWAAVFVGTGLFEEISFRGYLFHNLSAWFGAAGAMWTQAVLFLLLHVPNVAQMGIPLEQAWAEARLGLFNVGLIGVFFVLTYMKSGSLWFAIGFHAAWDFALGCLFSLPVSGIETFRLLDVTVAPSPLTGRSFGLEGSPLVSVVTIAMCLLLTRLKDHPQALADLAALKAGDDPETNTETIVEDEVDPTHVPRFKTSMRPVAAQPELDLRGMNTMSPKPQATIFTPPTTPPLAPTPIAAPVAPAAAVPDPATPIAAEAEVPLATPIEAPVEVPWEPQPEPATTVEPFEIQLPPIAAPYPESVPVMEPSMLQAEVSTEAQPTTPVFETPVATSTPIIELPPLPPIAQTAEPPQPLVTPEIPAPQPSEPPAEPAPPKPKKPAPKW